MKIKNIELKNNLILPPLAGYTDVGMRALCIKYGCALTFTEMVSAKGLLYENENTKDLLITDDAEVIKAVQLFSSEPEIVARAVNHTALDKFDIVDFNMGCPAQKIVRNGEGSALLNDPELIYKIILAAKQNTDKIISAKIRVGFTTNYFSGAEAADAIQSGGASFLTVHGRTRDMMYSGEVLFEQIANIKKNVSIPVFGNGDIVDLKTLEKMKETNVDGFAIGRGAIGNPYIFSILQGIDVERSLMADIQYHIRKLAETLPERVVVNNMKKHVVYYLKGIPNIKKYKDDIYQTDSIDKMLKIVDNIINSSQI